MIGSAAALRAWAEAGLMSLCGSAEGPPVAPSRDHAARALQLCEAYDDAAAMAGARGQANLSLLAERAAALDLRRNGSVSANRMCRAMRAADGVVVVNLARGDDLDLLQAWLGVDRPPAMNEVERLVAGRSALDLVSWGRILGLPVAAVPAAGNDPGQMAKVREMPEGVGRPRGRPPLVIDLSALWAGPLCGALLREAGARVIKVEDRRRLDGARAGDRGFFDRLNGGKESLTLDFTNLEDLRFLRKLIAKSDLIIEGSRPRALAQLGIDRDELMAASKGLSWLSITAYGREAPADGWVGFGDDVAMAAGLCEPTDKGNVYFIGDAITDPLTGIAAAGAALSALNRCNAFVIDISMVGVAGFVASAEPLAAQDLLPVILRRSARWCLRIGEADVEIARPQKPTPALTAPEPGADNDALRGEFG